MQWQGLSKAKSIRGTGLGCAGLSGINCEQLAAGSPCLQEPFVAVVIISLIMDPWQYNDNNHIMHICAEPVIPSAAPRALLGIVCAEEEGAASPGAEPGAGAAALPRCRGAKPWPRALCRRCPPKRGAQSRVEEEDGLVVRGEGRELDMLGYPGLSPFPPGPRMGRSVQRRARSPRRSPVPAAPAGLRGGHSPRHSRAVARPPMCFQRLLCPRGNCLVAAFQGVWECNYLRALITRQANISPSSSFTRAQQQLTRGEKAGVCRDAAVGLTLLHTGTLQTEFPPGSAREGTEHPRTDGPRRQRAAQGQAAPGPNPGGRAGTEVCRSRAVASRVEKETQGGGFPCSVSGCNGLAQAARRCSTAATLGTWLTAAMALCKHTRLCKDTYLCKRTCSCKDTQPCKHALVRRYALVQTHALVQRDVLVQRDLSPPPARPGGSGPLRAPFSLSPGCSLGKAALCPDAAGAIPRRSSSVVPQFGPVALWWWFSRSSKLLRSYCSGTAGPRAALHPTLTH